MSYPAYDSYKDSGIEWLGQVPSGWDVKRLKFCLNIENGRDYKDVESDTGYPVYGSGGPFTYASEYLYDGEAVLLGRKGTVDKPLYVNEKFWTVDTMYYCPPRKEISTRYMYYCSLCIPFSLYSTDTALPSMTQVDLNNHILCIPAHEEQQAITAFLDEETAAIDALIAKKEKLLELLVEKRTALITQAVTKGLDDTALMKPSGIDWLGDVPEGWEAIKLRFLCKINTGSRDTENRISDAKYPFFVRSQTIERIDTYALDCEAVLTAGDGVGVGKVFHYYDGKFDFHQRVYAFTDFHKIQGKFFFQFFSQFFGLQMNIYSAKSTVDSVRRPFLQELIMCVPPEEEQTKIVEFLEHEIVKFDKMEKAVRDAISKLKEYRAAIITNAVTGKIKVI